MSAPRTWWLVVLVLALAAACSDPPRGPMELTPLPVADLVSKQGEVRLERRPAGPVPAMVGALLEGDVLVTGPDSSALLRGHDGRELEVGESTRFKVGSSLAGVEVSAGTITFLADGDGGTEASTPFGRVRLSPGTRATYRLVDGGLSIDVAVGAITMIDDDGGSRSAGAGDRLEVGVGAISLIEPEKPPAVIEPEWVEVQLLPEVGKTLLKKKGEARFSPARKEAQPVAEGTAIQVPPQARARLTAPGLQLKLQPGLSGVLDSARTLGGVTAVALELGAGEAELSFDGAPCELSLGQATSLKASKAAATTVTRTRKSTELEVLAGEVLLTTPSGPRTVKAGERAVMAGGRLEVKSRPRPALMLPIGKRVRVYWRRPFEVGLVLPEGPSALAQVASDATFDAVLLSGEASDYVAAAAPAVGELHWRTLDAAGQSGPEGQARFLADKSGLHDEGSRSDTVAETGLKATVYFQSAVPTLTFTFPAQEGAKAYRLKVYRSGELKVPVVEKKSNENRCTVESGQLPEGTYVWYASPIDESGNEKGGGRMNKMDIVYDNSLTTLELASPKDGDQATGTAAGVAPLGSHLFINGKSVPLQPNGRFSAPLGGAELVVFRVVSPDGSEGYWLRRLRK